MPVDEWDWNCEAVQQREKNANLRLPIRSSGNVQPYALIIPQCGGVTQYFSKSLSGIRDWTVRGY